MGLGTTINVATVLVGGGIGTLVGARLPEGMRVTAMHAIGIVTLLVGVANFQVFAKLVDGLDVADRSGALKVFLQPPRT